MALRDCKLYGGRVVGFFGPVLAVGGRAVAREGDSMKDKAALDLVLRLARAERDKYKAQVEVFRLRARLQVAHEHLADALAAPKAAPVAEVQRFVSPVESAAFWRRFDIDSRLAR